jgi:hypothetical protein
MAMFTAHWIASLVLHVSMMVTRRLFQQSAKPVDIELNHVITFRYQSSTSQQAYVLV